MQIKLHNTVITLIIQGIYSHKKKKMVISLQKKKKVLVYLIIPMLNEPKIAEIVDTSVNFISKALRQNKEYKLEK